ncbi:MAG: thioesterase family protein [Verrucomicrobiota bacterium]
MGVFRHQHRVTYAECTVGNHVYYARYFDILEAARGEFFRALGCPFTDLHNQGTIFPAIECQAKYKGAARYDDLLTVEVWLTLLRGVRVTFAYRILNAAGQTIIEATTAHACTDIDEKPKRIPAEVIARLSSFLNPNAE